MPARVCLGCGQVFSRLSPKGRCPECTAELEQARPSRAIYDTPRWRLLSRATIRDHVRRHGWTCPGWGRPAHPSRDLTTDHLEPLARLLAAGLDVWDRANLAVLCRSCNGRKAASTPATR